MVKFPNTNLLLAVGGIIAAVFVIRELRNAGGDLQNALSGLKFPDINFPSFPDITFPSFPDIFNIFPEDNTSSIAGDTIVTDDGTTITIPDDNIVNPDGTVSGSPPTMDLSEAARLEALRQLELNRQRSIAEQALSEIPIDEDISGAELNAARNADEFQRRLDEQSRTIEDFRSQQNVQTDIEGNTFGGGGISFIGGTVTETPIRFLSLGQIIDRFNVSASRAADIRAQALIGTDQDVIGDFDFGTNTFNDQGIPELQNIGQTSGGFEGKTAEEIALILTGGNISNF